MKKVLFALPILLFLFSYIVAAQEDVLRPRIDDFQLSSKNKDVGFYLGFEAGLNFCFFNQKISPNAAPVFETVKTGNGNGFNGNAFYFGIIADFPINNSFGIQTRLNYDAKYVYNSGTGVDYTVDFNTPVPHNIDLTIKQEIQYISWSILARINATNDLFFTIGPTIQFRSGDIETTWQPLILDGTRAENFPFWSSLGMTGSAGVKKVSELGAIDTRVGLEFGAGYKIPIGKNIYLIPKAQFQFMLTKTADDTAWINYLDTSNYVTATDKMLHSLQLGVAVLFGI